MIKIMIVDDHPIVRSGLKNIISDESDMQIVCEASAGKQVEELVRENDLDIIILDISLPDISGFEILTRLRNLFPDIPVLMLSVMSEDLYASKSLKAGASGFINKESAPEELIIAIRKIISGNHYISPLFAEKIALDLKGKLRKAPHERLSSREFQVLIFIASGKPLSEIANNLSLNIKTVSTYRTRILEKMNVKSNADLVKYCINQGLL
jgi:two-component system, NarL family, invasion response regulator UvrY